MDYTFYVPTRTLFGAGVLNELHNQAMPGKKALLVTSCGKSARKSGALERTISELTQADIDLVLFSEVSANPTKSCVMSGAAAARCGKCDFIVALGGGSVMDAAKAISVMAVNDVDYWDYIGPGTGKGKPLANRPPPSSPSPQQREPDRRQTRPPSLPMRTLMRRSALAIRPCSRCWRWWTQS